MRNQEARWLRNVFRPLLRSSLKHKAKPTCETCCVRAFPPFFTSEAFLTNLSSPIALSVVRTPISHCWSPINRILIRQIVLLDINVKTLIPTDGDAKTFTQWIESGVFDALQRKYVRKITLSSLGNVENARIPADCFCSK